MLNIIVVFIGGGLGSIFRYLISKQFEISTSFFTPVMLVNIIGSLLIGIIFALLGKNAGDGSQNIYLFLTTGFLGGFTTFSAFSLDFLNFINNNQVAYGIIYLLFSVILSFIAVFAGYLIFR